MVSEKKARRYQQELVTVRDEALHALLRLKQMLDSKVKETEMLSLKQQQKVEELEAQLGEAEDIVGELRMELRELHYELKKLMNGQTHLKNDDEEKDSCWKNHDAAVSVGPEVSCSRESTEPVGSCIPVEQSGSAVANGKKIPSLKRINNMNRCSYKANKDQCHHTLPSLLTKRRETEGFAHAVNSSIASGDLSSSVDVGVCHHKVLSCKSNLEGDSSFEESRNMKQKTGEKVDVYLESLKPSFTNESSRDVVYA